MPESNSEAELPGKASLIEDSAPEQDFEDSLESACFGAETETAGEISPGQTLDNRYTVVSVLGAGGMGIVYKVEQPWLGKYFALKTVRSSYLSELAISRFRKEAKAAKALNHPGLIKVHDFGLLESGDPFMVMDLIESGSLADLIKANGRLSTDRVLNIFVQCADALAHAHEHKVIHRDLKPSNILIENESGQEKAKIADFGLAKILEDNSGASLRLTQTGEALGSPLYMSPEQCSGRKADQRSDIYSLACSMFEALTGTAPFKGETCLSTMLLHQKQEPPRLSGACPVERFSEGWEEIFAIALIKDPDLRYQSMSDLKAALLKINDAPAPETKRGSSNLKQKRQVTSGQLGVPRPVVALVTLAIFLLTSLATTFIFKLAAGKPAQKMKDEGNSDTEDGGINLIAKWNSATKEGDKTTKVDGKRIFHFPENHSMGYLYLSGHTFPRGVKPFCQAIGTVTVPHDSALRYRPNWSVSEFPSAFDRFAEDDLFDIDFANLPVTDQVLSHIGRLKSLHVIDLSNTEITSNGLNYLLDLPHLYDLSLANTDVNSEGVASLSRLKSLRELCLSYLRFDKRALDYFRQATYLKTLTIRNTHLKDQDLEALAGLKNLVTLRIDYNDKLTDDGLKYLTNLTALTELNVCECSHITPEASRYLKALPNLRKVYIAQRQWTEDQIAQFLKDMPHCQIEQIERGHQKKLDLKETLRVDQGPNEN